MGSTSFPFNVGEVSMPEIKGGLVAAVNLGIASGTLVARIAGPYLSLSVSASIYFGLAVFLIFLCLVTTIPSSTCQNRRLDWS